MRNPHTARKMAQAKRNNLIAMHRGRNSKKQWLRCKKWGNEWYKLRTKFYRNK